MNKIYTHLQRFLCSKYTGGLVSAELEAGLDQLKGYYKLRTEVIEDSKVGSSRNWSNHQNNY